jgi:hypothetical protein
MDLSKQVIILQQAKRLKELGIVQESAFYHDLNMYDEQWGLIPKHELEQKVEVLGIGEAYSAFTVAELGVLLPRDKYGAGRYYTIQDAYLPTLGFSVWDFNENEQVETVEKVYLTEAEARAALLIFLLENNHTTAEEVNQRLLK